MDDLTDLYNKSAKLIPSHYNLDAISEAGIYQLNAFIINCKALLQRLCNDIKNYDIQSKELYLYNLN